MFHFMDMNVTRPHKAYEYKWDYINTIVLIAICFTLTSAPSISSHPPCFLFLPKSPFSNSESLRCFKYNEDNYVPYYISSQSLYLLLCRRRLSFKGGHSQMCLIICGLRYWHMWDGGGIHFLPNCVLYFVMWTIMHDLEFVVCFWF